MMPVMCCDLQDIQVFIFKHHTVIPKHLWRIELLGSLSAKSVRGSQSQPSFTCCCDFSSLWIACEHSFTGTDFVPVDVNTVMPISSCPNTAKDISSCPEPWTRTYILKTKSPRFTRSPNNGNRYRFLTQNFVKNLYR
jgi:hypothetical protein